ncbi:MAG: TonB-dependent receptor [Bacteroidales bacterium]|nr:TonB-dependent receptor [Bacteroidales bacterium]
MKRKIFISLAIVFIIGISAQLKAQTLTQTIRGQVIDKDSKMPLMGVSLVISGTNPQVGTITDGEGNFKFTGLRVNRYDIEVYYLGYESKTVNDILLGVGKEVVLTIEMQESVIQMQGVEISAKKNKGETLNRMASVSARSFSVDETKRYAGSFNDPSRMAASFAGVSGNPDGDNDIIIRGNSPRGMLWKLEGIEIPNPNHFAEDGASGGPISILNSNMLDNSDFFTGAFPAEYGNALSGVFDINMRRGNNEKREYSLQASLIGTDCSIEGPFYEGYNGSYLINYRYSSLAMLNTIGIKLAGDAVPVFQDLAFHIELPTEKMGTYSIFGVGGMCDIFEEDEEYRNNFGTDMGVLGLKHTLFLDQKTYLKTTLATTVSRNRWKYEEVDDNNEYYIYGRENFLYQNELIDIALNRKWNAKNSIKTGFTYTRMSFDLFSDYWDEDMERLIKDVEDDGTTSKIQSYVSWKYRVTDKITMTNGLSYMYFDRNEKYSLEPRVGMRWQFLPAHTLSAGFGIHSRMESLTSYYAELEMEDGSYIQPNKNMDFTKARHYVMGYEHNFTPDLLVKTEMYIQDLYNIPVYKDSSNSFSALNYSDGYTATPMVNSGTGLNYGAEVTVEKFFSNNYYFLVTTSLYNSTYEGSDGMTYNSKYNGNYVFNVLGGKEWVLKNNGKKRILGISGRTSIAGGMRYNPIDEVASANAGYTIRKETPAFSAQRDPFFRADLKLRFRTEKKMSTRIWEIDIQNVTNKLNVVGDYWNSNTGKVETWTQMGLLPVLSYRIEF